MACLATAIGVRPGSVPAQKGRERAARMMWTLGCVLLWIHVGCAFQFQHHWSHAVAYVHTAEKTAEMTGFNWGGGVYFNYLVMVVWAGDALWWWVAPDSHRKRPAVSDRLIVGFILFIAFNAAVVFASGWPRWIALATCITLLIVRWKLKPGSEGITASGDAA